MATISSGALMRFFHQIKDRVTLLDTWTVLLEDGDTLLAVEGADNELVGEKEFISAS